VVVWVGGVSVPPGVTVFCNPTLAPAFRALDGLGGVPVAALSAPAGLMLAQMTRHTRDDLLFTTSAAVDQAGLPMRWCWRRWQGSRPPG
jgi:hypothetical protein